MCSAPVTEQPVSFVNGPQLAAERGLVVREISSSSARDYVNLVEVRGRTTERSTHVAGTLYGKQDAPRIVAIDDHIVDIAPSSHMLVVSNNDTPGMMGIVGTFLGDAGINIDELDLGTGPTRRRRAHGAVDVDRRTATVVDQLRAQPGIVGAQAIELD